MTADLRLSHRLSDAPIWPGDARSAAMLQGSVPQDGPM